MTSKFACFGPGFFCRFLPGFLTVGLPKKTHRFFWVRARVSELWSFCISLSNFVIIRLSAAIGSGVMMSYLFFQDGGHRVGIYFRIQFWWGYSFGKMEIYWHTKFRWDISVHGWDKTTFGFWKRTAVILEFCFRFLFSSACHSALAYQISSKWNYPWLSYDVISIFSRWWPAAILDLIWITLDD